MFVRDQSLFFVVARAGILPDMSATKELLTTSLMVKNVFEKNVFYC